MSITKQIIVKFQKNKKGKTIIPYLLLILQMEMNCTKKKTLHDKQLCPNSSQEIPLTYQICKYAPQNDQLSSTYQNIFT